MEKVNFVRRLVYEAYSDIYAKLPNTGTFGYVESEDKSLRFMTSLNYKYPTSGKN